VSTIRDERSGEIPDDLSAEASEARTKRMRYATCEATKTRQHEWRRVGSVTHYANSRLGTWSATEYYKCAECGELGEKHDYNNYSGD
jgi:hypothetical protein